jgi:uncharacterized protein YjiS (DUF1127 family)
MTTSALRNRFALRHTTVSGTFAQTWTVIRLWRERARQRRHLAALPADMLRDIGVSPRAARAEAARPFWIA